MSASVHTTISPRALSVPIRRAVPEPPLRRNGMTRIVRELRASAAASTASVSSVEASSMASSS